MPRQAGSCTSCQTLGHIMQPSLVRTRIEMCWSCVIAGLLGISFSLLALWMGLDTGYRRWTLVHGIVGITGFVLSFVGSLAILLPAVLRYPVITCDERGISFRTAFFMSGWVPWRSTTEIRAFSTPFAKYIVIELQDISGFIETQPIWLRPVLRYSAKLKWPTCMVLIDCRKNSSKHTDTSALLRKIRAEPLHAT